MDRATDLDFRPASYWSEHKRATADLRGTYRRKALKEALLRQDSFKISELMGESDNEAFKMALGRINPTLRSGEDLPLLRKNETEIARLRLTQTIHEEVTSIRARRRSGRIEYNIWAEAYTGLGDFKYRTVPRSSVEPLSMRELVKLIDTAKLVSPDGSVEEEGLVFRIWEYDHQCGKSRDVVRRSLEISSEFYPQLTQYYDEQFLVWAAHRWSGTSLRPLRPYR